jgi:Zn-dependent peptidase ImmA (M78 family)/transcriptional regulator with XRE-family HTH domain
MASVHNRAFNPDMLILARQSRSLSQRELAEAAGVTQGYVSKLESGVAAPLMAKVGSLAKVLDYPVEIFFRPEQMVGLPATFARKRVRLGKRVLERIQAEINLRRMNVAVLLRSVQLDTIRDLPVLDPDEHGGSVECASLLRALWQIPPGPIRNLVALLEDAGIIMVPLDFGVREVDAIAQYVPGVGAMIFYNTSAPMDRLRFTLAHELGHLVMHRTLPSGDMEAEADAFAAEFMAPARDIAPHFTGTVTLSTLAALKPVWRLSMAMLLRSARRTGKISQARYTALQKELSSRGWRLREPPETDIAPEEPTIFHEVLNAHVQQLGYTFEELGRALTLFPREVREVYFMERPRLRLVRGGGGESVPDRDPQLRVML